MQYSNMLRNTSLNHKTIRGYDTLETVKKIATRFLLISVLLECVFFPSFENIFGCIVLIYGWLLISKTVLKRKYVQMHFIPFVAIFFYGLCFFVLPIAATLLEGKPVTFRFQVPYITFFNLMINATVIAFAFRVCHRIYHEGWLTRLWQKLGYFKVPTNRQIWILGGIGLMALIYQVSILGTDMMQAENKGAIGQIISFLQSFAFFPIALCFPKYYGKSTYKIPYKSLIIYFSIIIIIGIITTVRSLILNFAVVAAVMYFFSLLIENKKVFTLKTNIILIIGFYLLTGPIADLALAMILSRQMTRNQSSEKIISNIWNLYNDKELLHSTLNLSTLSNTDNKGDNFLQWSEYYLDNIFLDRFCNLRTQDLTLDYATKLGYNNPVMHEYAQNHLLFQVPTPILRTFGYEANKFDLNYFPGDAISTEALGLKTQYKGFRIAGTSGIGLYWLGYSYYLLAFLIYIPTFYFLSSLTSSKIRFLIPVPVICSLMFYLRYFNNGIGLFRSIDLLIRNGWQEILIYCLLMWLIRKFVK